MGDDLHINKQKTRRTNKKTRGPIQDSQNLLGTYRPMSDGHDLGTYRPMSDGHDTYIIYHNYKTTYNQLNILIHIHNISQL
jgi:hypothetical protein